MVANGVMCTQVAQEDAAAPPQATRLPDGAIAKWPVLPQAVEGRAKRLDRPYGRAKYHDTRKRHCKE